MEDKITKLVYNFIILCVFFHFNHKYTKLKKTELRPLRFRQTIYIIFVIIGNNNNNNVVVIHWIFNVSI